MNEILRSELFAKNRNGEVIIRQHIAVFKNSIDKREPPLSRKSAEHQHETNSPLCLVDAQIAKVSINKLIGRLADRGENEAARTVNKIITMIEVIHVETRCKIIGACQIYKLGVNWIFPGVLVSFRDNFYQWPPVVHSWPGEEVALASIGRISLGRQWSSMASSAVTVRACGNFCNS